ncbi:helix-turn-helix transcriptional regulator [Kineosporia sp. J2-2]|uniref:Helix-turn-helix transcriptional regulator n=1 Tax=Kineosporia corallincola TaxID=2835133 RepID=A0ABS5TJ64_9ACTN|nr:helix-turn-helix transcriptional regulator [Kineosporia corallincola]MBT0771139.1 helix-turn-helix transcriptional regulator [Kineosporia corallincola]
MLLRGLIGTVLRRIRLGQGRTLRDVAEAARVSVPYLSEVERGRKEASSELLGSICEALGLDLIDLLSEVRFELETERLAQLASQPRTIGFTALAQSELAPRPSLSSSGGVGLHAVPMVAA